MHSFFQQPQLSEDTVYYTLHILPTPTDATLPPLDSTIPPWPSRLTPNVVETLHLAVTQAVAAWTSDYMWQKEPFALTQEPVNELNPSTPILSGETRYGDCMDDEWFVVYLVRRITQVFPYLVARVYDTDGEILLIEAAEHLPDWLTPQTSGNRVFLHRGDLHIIPHTSSESDPLLTKSELDDCSTPTLHEALSFLATRPQLSRAASDVQTAAFRRLEDFPQIVRTNNSHRTRCFVPHRVAHLLHHQPQLLAAAIEAFYQRDPVSIKACLTMRQFPPAPGVLTTVRWTRTLYAQAVSQKFVAPKVFDEALISHENLTVSEKDLGTKIACGFEILCQEIDMSDDHALEKWRTRRGQKNHQRRWNEYKRKLANAGYFGEEIAGSQRYKELETRAREQFDNTGTPAALKEATDSNKPREVLETIHQLWRLLLVDRAELQKRLISQNDSDEWMYIRPEHLDALLQKQQKNLDELYEDPDFAQLGQSEARQGAIPADQELNGAVDLAEMVDKFQTFLNQASGPDGVEFPRGDNQTDAGELDGKWSEASSEISEEDFAGDSISGRSEPRPVRLDPDRFFETLQQMLGINEEKAANHGNTSPENSTPSDRRVRFVDPDQRDPSTVLTTMMAAMDAELEHTKLAASFTREPDSESSKPCLDDRSTAGTRSDTKVTAPPSDTLPPVDVDLNLVTNMLESFKSQQGLPGPTDNMLKSFGLFLPPHSTNPNDSEI
ncbi:hypothetical protein IWQ61_010035 [Dispira simplex]|nr:hypothetical protein IWQ61_010035 [Dispira simplex]